MTISLCHKNIPISSITFFELAFCETLDNKANWVWSACKRNIYFYFFYNFGHLYIKVPNATCDLKVA